MNAVVEVVPLTAKQRDDLATLLSRTSTSRNLGWLSQNLTGVNVAEQSANQVGDTLSIAKALVALLVEKDVTGDAVALLQREFPNNLYLSAGLDAILRDERLDSPNLQTLINLYEPLFNSWDFQEMLPRVRATVCAVAGGGKLLGTGFLVGPSHVLTNFHVLKDFMKLAANGQDYEAKVPGTDICCVFDYSAEPPPKLNDEAQDDSRVMIVHAAEQWLIHARTLLPGDGTSKAPPKVDTEFDYALIELARPVGEKPSRISGGALRGWLSLSKDRDYLGGKRVVLFQHPGGRAQQFDIGDLAQIDPTGTRVWYRVSSAHGSSGGAAVAHDGTLLALHNASVDSPPGPAERVNQGVRIDLITKDLEETAQKWKPLPPPEQHPLAFWSLTDSLNNPKPIIGRQKFRDGVLKMKSPTAERLLTVIGEYGTFVGFTLQLLERTIGKLVPIARFSLDQVETLTPPEFVTEILAQLTIEPDPTDPMPLSAPPTETDQRWLRIYLPQWLGRQLARHEKLRPGVLPAWVAIDSTSTKIAPPNWKKGLREFVVALCGSQDAGQSENVTQLRVLLMSSVPLPVGNLPRLEEDLINGVEDKYAEEFATCMSVAWLTINKKTKEADDIFFSFAGVALEANQALPKPVLPRKLLAQHAIALLKKARGR